MVSPTELGVMSLCCVCIVFAYDLSVLGRMLHMSLLSVVLSILPSVVFLLLPLVRFAVSLPRVCSYVSFTLRLTLVFQ